MSFSSLWSRGQQVSLLLQLNFSPLWHWPELVRGSLSLNPKGRETQHTEEHVEQTNTLHYPAKKGFGALVMTLTAEKCRSEPLVCCHSRCLLTPLQCWTPLFFVFGPVGKNIFTSPSLSVCGLLSLLVHPCSIGGPCTNARNFFLQGVVVVVGHGLCLVGGLTSASALNMVTH